ncbi:hypothetical protein IW150_001150 [Coemansia sp. RSA 2607]|nr:hypothetical protein IW150_001150 [Coemansia sp. RSA 2607]
MASIWRVVILLCVAALAVWAGDNSNSDGTKTDIKGGGGDGATGTGTLGDNPALTSALFPLRTGFVSKAKVSGDGDSSRPYTPNPAYFAGAVFPTEKQGVFVRSDKFNKYSPAIYYAAPQRYDYPGAWGYGYYLIYPYPWWAYGVGTQMGPTFYANQTTAAYKTYKSTLRNMTVVNDTNVPFIGDYDLFGEGKVSLVDFNNGTLQISPCGVISSDNNDTRNCTAIVLDITAGKVVSGSAEVIIQNQITFFNLGFGDKNATLRTITISSTSSKTNAGAIIGTVIGFGIFGIIVVAWIFCCIGMCACSILSKCRYHRRARRTIPVAIAPAPAKK